MRATRRRHETCGCTLDTYERALDCLGSHSGFTRTAIADAVAQLHPERSAAYLRSCLSPYDSTHTLQLAIAPAFTIASGNPALLIWHAQACGFGVHPLGAGEATSDDSALLLHLMTLVGELAAQIQTDDHAAARVTARRAIAVLADVRASASAREISCAS